MIVSNCRLFLYSQVARHLPSNAMRIVLLRWCGVKIGQNVVIHRNASFSGSGGTICIGDNVMIGPFTQVSCRDRGSIIIQDGCKIQASCFLAAKNGARILLGRNVNVAHFVSMQCSTHSINLSKDAQSMAGAGKYEGITVGDGCWICAGAIVLPGVNIGRFSIVGAGAVVLKSCGERTLLVGNPAMEKKKYHVVDEAADEKAF